MNRTRFPSRALPPALAWMFSLSPSLWLVAVLLVAIAALFPGLWTLIGLGGLLVCTLILVRPDVGVYLLALSIPLGSLYETKVVGNLTLSPTEVLAGLLAVAWITRALARRRIVIPLTPLFIALVAMISVIALSAFQATDLALTAKETLKWLELLLVYLYVIAEMGTRRQAMTLLGFLFAGALIEAAIGLVQFSLGIGPDNFAIGRFMRAYGTFDQPNPYAGYLGMVIPMTVGVLLSRPSPRTRNAVLLVLLLAAGGVLASMSRGAWVGITLAVAAMMVLWSARTRLLLGIGALAVVPAGALAFLNLLPVEITDRVATAVDYFRFIDVSTVTVTPENWSVIERVAHWQAALNMISAHPLLGVGAGNYSAVYSQYMVPGWTLSLGHAHNFYLNMAAETGIPGLLVYLTVLVVAAIHVVKWLARSGERQINPRQYLWRGVLAGVLGALVASAVHNMFDNLFVHGMSIQLGMLLALAQVAATSLSGQVFNSRSQPTS